MYKYFIGIDISKDSFDFSIIDCDSKKLNQGKLKMFNSDFSDFNNLLSDYNQDEVLIIMESTGSYHFTLLSFLLENNFKVAVANPTLISNFIKSSTLRKSKTDEKDAFSIANFGSKLYSTLRLTKVSFLENLKPIIREREMMSKNIAKVKTGIKTVLNLLFPELLKEIDVFTKTSLSIIKRFPSARLVAEYKIKKLDKEILKVTSNRTRIHSDLLLNLATNSIAINNSSYETVLISKINSLNYYQEQVKILDEILNEEMNEDENNDLKILKSIKGVGDVTAKSFLIEIGTIDNFISYKQLIAYFGTDPAISQSGSSINKQGKISKRGNKHLRRNIWLMTVCVIRSTGRFREYFRKKRNEGMKYKKAVIATANKLIRTLFGMLKSKTEYA